MPVTEVPKERMDQINGQLLNAGAIGFLKGTIFAIVTGAYLSFRYNHKHNARFFSTPAKAWYFISWGIVGITFSVENAKVSLTRDLAEETDLRRRQFFSQELNGKGD